MSSAPPSWRTSLATTSMPTPRPARRLTVSAVEKPGSMISASRSASASTRVGCGSGRARSARLRIALAVEAARRRRRLPARLRSLRGAPRCGPCLLPACSPCVRSAGDSRPCATALRSMCSSGAVMRSSTLRSSSPCAPSSLSCTCLPVSLAAWRTTRRRRGTSASNGTMRVRMRPSCSSELTRDCCSSRVSYWRVRSSSDALQRRPGRPPIRPGARVAAAGWRSGRARADRTSGRPSSSSRW